MADLTAKKSNLASRAVQAAGQLKDARNALAALRSEYDAAGITFVDADFVGANAHLTATAFGALMTTQANLETLWAAGNGTNVCKATP